VVTILVETELMTKEENKKTGKANEKSKREIVKKSKR